METSTFLENVERNIDELKPFWKAFDKETDRATAIVAGCLLDDLLERIIRASYVKDPQVKSLFKNDHILQSLFPKINIAYFSGLIPSVIYHDLKLMCEIRNRFAHAVIADLRFTDETVVQRIDRFALGPKTVTAVYPPKMKFIVVVSQIVAVLQVLEYVLSKKRPAHLVELLELDKAPFTEWALTQAEIRKLLPKDKYSHKGC
jgi:DNA-binding MltR family transcriptional regulator